MQNTHRHTHSNNRLNARSRPLTKRLFPLSQFVALFLLASAAPLFGANITALPNSNPSNQIPGGGFEDPVVSSSLCPAGALVPGWTLNSSAKIAPNFSHCTRFDPVAPEGNQALLLDNGGVVNTTLNVNPGLYRLSLKTVTRLGFQQLPNNGLSVSIKVDGIEVLNFTPGISGYQTVTTPLFYLNSGTETLEVIANCCILSANSTLIDDLRLQAVSAWSAPATWDGNAVPTAADNVTIPAGTEVMLDVNAAAKHIHLLGNLYASLAVDLNLDLEYLLIDGAQAKLEWGTENQPYEKRGIITLIGNDPSVNILDNGTKFIGAINGGTIEIHGQERFSWTQLAATANKDDLSITVKDPTDWKVGDHIVLASTDFDAGQAEERTLTSVSNGGTTFGFATPLIYTHFGDLQYFDNGTRVLDERGEVGLLSRNITIQGDQFSTTNGFGGHLIIRGHLSEGRVSGVEFYRMGQKGELGRYPFHWHHAHDASGQYIKNSSIHLSYNRLVTIHRTNNSVVEDNVGYDHIGHGYFLEDASEQGNTLHHNLGVLTKKPAAGEEVRAHDLVPEPNTPFFKLPATFWITNPDNYFTDNAAAGSEGSGFWMTAQAAVISGDPVSIPPRLLPIGSFTGNRTHSNSHSGFAIDGQVVTDSEGNENFIFGHYAPHINGVQNIPVIQNLTSFKNRSRGLWTRANTLYFEQCFLANNATNTFFAFSQEMKNSLTVGTTNNIGRLLPPFETAVGHSLPIPNQPITHPRNHFYGHILYDGSSGIENVHFANFYGGYTFCIGISGAHRKSPVHWSRNISFENNIPNDARVNYNVAAHYDNVYSNGLIDYDGSVTGIANSRLVPKIKYIGNGTDDPLAVRESGFTTELGDPENLVWNAVTTDNLNVATIWLQSFWPTGQFSPTYFMRTDGPPNVGGNPAYMTLGDHAVGNRIHQPSVFTDGPRSYFWQYHRLPGKAEMNLQFAQQNARMVSAFPNVPSSIYVDYKDGSTLVKANHFLDLLNSTTEKYLLLDNVLYINHLANTGGYDPQYGHNYSYKSKVVRICTEQNCTTPGTWTDGVVMADFETGINGKGILLSNGMPIPTVSTSVTNPATAPFDMVDDFISFQVTSDADGVNDYVQYTVRFQRQAWTHFDHLSIHLEGAPFRVYLKDQESGFFNLGKHQPSTSPVQVGIDHLSKTQRDNVQTLLIRVYEEDIGDLSAFGVSALIKLFHIGLEVNTGSPRLATLADEPTISLSEGAQNSPLQVSPNPTTGQFTLSAEFEQATPLNLRVYDLRGIEIAQWSGETSGGSWSQTFNTHDWKLSSGLYQVVLQSDSGLSSVKLVVE